jgi:hypothetical protein
MALADPLSLVAVDADWSRFAWGVLAQRPDTRRLVWLSVVTWPRVIAVA